MALIERSIVAAALAAGALMTGRAAATPSHAASCLNRMAGEGAGMGAGGVGTQNARASAATDWSRKVEARHGARFASFAKARGARYDCRTGFVLEVKCALSAQPCR